MAAWGLEPKSPACQPSPGTGLRLGHAGVGSSHLEAHIHLPSPWHSAEADDSQIPRQLQDVWLSFPGAGCPFSAQPTAHLPCDLPLHSPSILLAPPFTGERREGEGTRGESPQAVCALHNLNPILLS